MAAAIKVGGKNRYHVHRILMPDGSEFEFKEKTEPTSAGVPTTKGSKGSAVSPVSDSSIPENSENSKKQFSLPGETSVYDYINEHGTEFADAPPVRDYERTKQRVKNQTCDELAAQVNKFSRDKRFTHGKVLDKTSVKVAMNDMVRTLMTYSESYTTDGKLRKINLKLVNMATENAAVVYKAIKEGDYAEASIVAYETARGIVENIELVNDAAFRGYKKLCDYLRPHL